MDRFKLSLAGREKVSLVAVALTFLFLVGGLIKLQLIDHAEMMTLSENNRIRVVPIMPRRGVVYDREGRVIIDNRPSYTVSVIPAEEVSGTTVPNLATLIGLDTTEVRRRIKRNLISRYQPAAVKQDIPFEVVAILEEQARKYPGVTYQMQRVRQYSPEMGIEAFTGYVGEVSQDDLDKRGIGADYRLGSMIGKEGLEKQYDELLRGREGTEYIEVSASGQMIGTYEGRERIDAEAGTDLHLTIDNDIQRVAVAALDTFCCGAIVAMDPRDGDLLAMVSYPGYDPNIFSSVIPESLWNAISNDSTHPLLNRPLNGLYPPGSTTKLITVGAGLEEGEISPETLLKPCLGGMQFGNRFFRCWDHAGHGKLEAVHAIEQSCDVYMYQLGRKLGIDVLARYFRACGFGTATTIDLPGESAGLNPDSKYYDRRYGEGQWTWTLVLNNAIGQGEILCTPLQLAQFYCGVANGGRAYHPHILQATKSGQTGEAARRYIELPFSKGTLALLMDGLRLVVEGEHGTARRLKNKYYTIGGKTGTAQNPHGLEHSWFVGLAPLDEPEIVVAAIVENAGHGSEVAAPLVGRVIEAYMTKRNVSPDMAQVTETGEQ